MTAMPRVLPSYPHLSMIWKSNSDESCQGPGMDEPHRSWLGMLVGCAEPNPTTVHGPVARAVSNRPSQP